MFLHLRCNSLRQMLLFSLLKPVQTWLRTHDSFTLPYPWHRFSSSDYLSPPLHSSETRKKGAVGELKAHSVLLPLHLLHLLFRSHLLRSVFTPFLFHTHPPSPSRGGRNIHSFKLGAHAGEAEDCTRTHVYGGRTTYGERGESMKMMLAIPLQN